MNNNNRPALQTRLPDVRHPSDCIGNPYSQDLRAMVMFIQDQFDLVNNPQIHQLLDLLRLNSLYPSDPTRTRWTALRQVTGHFRACRRSGGKIATRLRGIDLILLAMYRIAYPKCSIAEINGFLFRANHGNLNFAFYHPSQISRAEQMIGLSRKRGSTTAYQAYFPINLRKRWVYWNLAFPLGIGGIPRSRIIDLDECGLFVETANRPHGKSSIGFRVREEGPYSKSEKWTLMLAICGEDGTMNEPSRRWADVWTEGGTTIARMLDFMQHLLDAIGPATHDNFYVFTMDNLNSHKNVQVVGMIYLYGHGVVFRAPYWAVDGPIEYVFNTVQTLIRSNLYNITNGNDLIHSIYTSVQSMNNFGSYFTHVGFI